MSALKLIALIVFYAILSWVLVHLLAVFGVFVALAYPIWWVLLPGQTICFSCRSLKQGKWCKFCRKEVKKDDPGYPHVASLRSAIWNGLVILIFTVISIGLVFGEAAIFEKLGIPPTPRTVSFVIPAKGQYRLGEIFPMKIEIVGIETPVNAVQADISFDPVMVEVLDINTDESFANIFIQKEINNEAGYARLTGGLPNPGFFSDRGVFGTILFKSKSPGILQVDFLPTSMVLANDGRGTNVLKDFSSVSYLILPETITKDEEELQKKLLTKEGETVLGASTSGTKMQFFGEIGGSVLGTSASEQMQESNESEKKSFLVWLFEIVWKIDSFVIEKFCKFFGLRNN